MQPRHLGLHLGFLLASLVLPTVAPAQDADPYASDRLVRVEITMPAADWQRLRLQHRDFARGITRDHPYTWFSASVKIDGQEFAKVGVRKKGFFGSVVSNRPSLKISFGKYTKKQRFGKLDQLTLNNNIQDATHLHQYLAYRMFRKAGVPAPRCNLAVVTVNGEKLGIYSNVESIRKPFVKRAFGEKKGTLYEGYAGDFVKSGQNGLIVNKWNDEERRSPAVDAVSTALAADSLDVAKLEQLIDLDGFVRFWAVECLIGHWDGYAGNRNNYYLYRDAKTQRFHFIPWGADAVFQDPGPFIVHTVPKSVKAMGLLCKRLWTAPEVRKKYVVEMKRLLADVFDEKAIRKEIARVGKMIAPHVDGKSWRAATGKIHAFLATRREQVTAELDADGPDWPDVKSVTSPKKGRPTLVRLEGTFAAAVGRPGKATFTMTVPGKETPAFDSVTAMVLPQLPQFIRPGYPAILLTGKGPGGRMRSLTIIVDPLRYAAAQAKQKAAKTKVPVDHFAVWAMLVEGAPRDPKAKRHIFGIGGTVTFDALGTKPGEPVKGSFALRLAVFGK